MPRAAEGATTGVTERSRAPGAAGAARRGAPLAARELPALLDRVHAALSVHRESIDELNVFPVPDGDTGTNMTLTVRSGLDALREAGRASGEELSRAVVRGAVRGARGNSGVILSQVVRAVVEVITGHREVDARLYAEALERARDLAYEAVAEPVEGTILTVVAAAAAAARRASDAGADLVATSAQVCEATSAAVQRTREQLAVLRDAGVVDAGGLGFEVLVGAVHGHLTGEEPPIEDVAPVPVAGGRADHEGCAVSPDHPFEVQYLLDASDEDAAPLRERLEQLGDSVVVVAAGGLLNVHVHTAEVGSAIEEGLRVGEPSNIEVTHFGDQIAARRAERAARVGVIAVVDGVGLHELARAHGAVVVPGRAGELPSVAAFVDAISSQASDNVVVLPGHRNAVAAALQAAELASSESDREVTVVEAAITPPAILAALAVLDPAAPAQAVIADLTAATEAVRAGEVVAAVRDAATPVGDVEEGQFLAIADGEVVAVCSDALEALDHVAAGLAVSDAELVSLLVGADVGTDERARAVAAIDGTVTGELDVVDAGQRPARFWVAVE